MWVRSYRRSLECMLAVVSLCAVVVCTGSAVASEPATQEAIGAVVAIDSDVDYGEYLAGECMGCHSVDAADDATVPRIHGSEAQLIVAALLDYRSGARGNTTMGSVAGALGDEEIAALAQFLAAAGAEKEN